VCVCGAVNRAKARPHNPAAWRTHSEPLDGWVPVWTTFYKFGFYKLSGGCLHSQHAPSVWAWLVWSRCLAGLIVRLWGGNCSMSLQCKNKSCHFYSKLLAAQNPVNYCRFTGPVLKHIFTAYLWNTWLQQHALFLECTVHYWKESG
jgi:hypothetical protein